jgi:hypothetical protein
MTKITEHQEGEDEASSRAACRHSPKA